MSQISRPPVVTILGHVDHGKTTLLDFIRKSAVAAKEHGGITQVIGAYQAEGITFIDTPGHAAFERMRSRGAEVADVAVLVIAVDDGIMPQTTEAVKHIQAANISMIVAVNKIDLPGVNTKVQLEKIKKQLSDQGVLVEEYGGEVPIVPLSAKTGEGVEDLLETIKLVAEIHEFKGDSDKAASGVVLESRLDKFKGPVATVLVRDGSLQKGDLIMAGGTLGKVKGMFGFQGQVLDQAGPSTPVEVLGFNQAPAVGSRLGEVGAQKEKLKTEAKSLIDKLKETESQVLNIIIKADTQGSLEAIEEIVEKMNQDQKNLKIVSLRTGEISNSDIEMAISTKAIVLGFNVKMVDSAKKLAEAGHVLVRTYTVIYELIEELEDVVEGILQPEKVEEVFGRAQIIAEFPFGKGERVAGCKVLEGVINKGPKVRIIRGDPSAGSGQVIGEGKIKSLKKVKEEVNKVEKGQECGILVDPALDFQIGDLVESFRTL